METILIIEDSAPLLRGLKDNFEAQGYTVKIATDGETGLNEALRLRPDLILLDLMLPKINGYEICRHLRREKFEMPIIMLTAKSEEADLVLGLHIGADDYVTKPFSIKELLARAEAFLRRNRLSAPDVFWFGDCEFHSAARRLAGVALRSSFRPKSSSCSITFFGAQDALSAGTKSSMRYGAMTAWSLPGASTDSSRSCGKRLSKTRKSRNSSRRSGNMVTNSYLTLDQVRAFSI